MEYTLEVIVFYILLIDSVTANLIAWTNHNKWYMKAFTPISKYFPLAKGWTTYYLILVIWIGHLMISSGTVLY